MSKEPMESSCWLWGGSYYSSGYGQVWSRQLRRGTQAHRFVYEALAGEIPKGKQIDHLCRVRGCVNPAHLRLVTPRENIMAPGTRCVARRNAQKEFCPAGHPYGEANTYLTRSGKRQCRTCKTTKKRQARNRVPAHGVSPVRDAVSLGSRGVVSADTNSSSMSALTLSHSS